jgi:hypothetical protein
VPAGTYGFFCFFNASTGNTSNYRGYAPFGGGTKGFFSVDTTLTNDQVFSVAHGLADGDRVMLFNVFAETLPTGVSEGTVYFVVNSATNTFKVSTTSGGAAVDITAVGGGEGFWQKVVPEVFASQGQITVAARRWFSTQPQCERGSDKWLRLDTPSAPRRRSPCPRRRRRPR